MVTCLGPPAPPTREGEIISVSRTTCAGHLLHYELQILQQPERARACGSGPKSSADRRPVDPPPVVQMRILEGPYRETAQDITFAYNADFFLYANLHLIDDIPSARLVPPDSPPVLTGMPVSSMILLDRPSEAGYFIFSDLSVRHEGKYYLTFSLMEEVKEDRYKDVDDVVAAADEANRPKKKEGSGRAYTFRTMVFTDEFHVYSAKKFPGLQESTALSRTVAEQGCRVRIRRDVRMRRRQKGKSGKDVRPRHDEYAGGSLSERSPTMGDRSFSNINMEPVPHPLEFHARSSGMDFAPLPGPSLAASRSCMTSHNTFGGRQPVPYAPPHLQAVPSSPLYPPPHSSTTTSLDHRLSFPHNPEDSPEQPCSSQAPLAARDMQPPPPPRAAAAAQARIQTLAPRLEAEVVVLPPQSRETMLPPISELPPLSEFALGIAPLRRPSYERQPIAPIAPGYPYLAQKPDDMSARFEADCRVSRYKVDQQATSHQNMDYASPPPRAHALHPAPGLGPQDSPSRKRTAEEAFPVSELQRTQNVLHEVTEEPPIDGRLEDGVDGVDGKFMFSEPTYERTSGLKLQADFIPLRD